jgi:Ca-activated chloride channel homolog
VNGKETSMLKASGVRIWLLILLAGCISLRAQPDAQVQQRVPTFSVSVDLVKVPITVFGLSGAPVQELSRGDFRIYEDGQMQEIHNFNLDQNPVSVVLLIDSSGTVTKEWGQIKDAAEGFAEALISRSGKDRISVITFSDDVERVMDWSSDYRKVHQALNKVKLGLRTDLYDAMLSAAQEQLKDIEGRKAIILLTDFLNNQSFVGYQDAVRAVVQSQASLYIVSKTKMVREAARTQRRVVILNDIYRRLFGDENYIDEFFAKKEAQMNDLAEKTGGRCYFPLGYNQIKDVYKQVAQELKNQYYITYVSQSNKERNSYHRITVEYLPPSTKLIYRRGYYFQPDPVLNPREGMKVR